ncbi:ABC transporter ATP-binding protein [Lentilactobacillus sp. Marseille-Q4993]|uniref:ABC transporter ATP-binding protein n=1 Tax=Lentilactobacillus sp. Marseille-Q4993 TaxID=3039492 RepID=UPI0024BC21D3|nr:ABC transporter ATP-binding protein [Lentilactobacillus sp. Marseille-Q4993]
MADVSVTNFSFKYNQANTNTLEDENLTFQTNHFSLLSGPSGSGKTTLLKFIAGLYPKFVEGNATGSIQFDGKDITSIPASDRNQLVAMMFQNPDQQFAMNTVKAEMTFVLENIQTDPAKMDDIIDNALKFVGISDLKNREINTLSGGQKQRLALASIIAMDSEVIVLDEPFASIDYDTRVDLIARLKQLQTEHGKTIILSDHDLSNYKEVIDDFFYLDPATRHIAKLNNTQKNAFFQRFEQTKIKETVVAEPSASDPKIINFADFNLKPHGDSLLQLNGFNFYRGKTTLVTGENGIGKSTLFDAMTRLTKYQGTISYAKKNIAKIKPLKYAQNVSLLFQDAESQFLNITVKEELDLSLKNRFTTNYSEDNINQMLGELHLDNRMDQVVYSLSEGQKKKLQILEMLIMNPPVLLLDEPLKGLDYDSLRTIVGYLKDAKIRFNQTQIIISHQFSGIIDLIDYHVDFAAHNLTYQEVLK